MSDDAPHGIVYERGQGPRIVEIHRIKAEAPIGKVGLAPGEHIIAVRFLEGGPDLYGESNPAFEVLTVRTIRRTEW